MLPLVVVNVVDNSLSLRHVRNDLDWEVLRVLVHIFNNVFDALLYGRLQFS